MPAVSVFFRHVAAIIFLLISRHFLSAWYQFHQPALYLTFAGLFTGSLVLAGWFQFQKVLRKKSFTRLLPILALLILALPWGEWLRLNFATSREDWSRQIFQQTVFIYSCLLLFGSFPQIAVRIHQYAKTFLGVVSESRFLWLLPALFFCVSSGIALFVMDRLPLVQDSASYLFQAKIFSRLKLYAPAPPVPEFFTHAGDMLVIKDGRWFSMYLPGYAALLAIPMLLHAEWFLSPLLGALTLFIWMLYAIRWHNRTIAVLLGLLCLLSPFLFLMSSTVLVHPLELFIATSVIYLCRRETESSSPGRQTALFFLMMIGMFARGFSLFAFLGPVLAYVCWTKLKNRSWFFSAVLLAGMVVGVTLTCLYQWKTTGNPFQPGYSFEYPLPHRLGFVMSINSQVHTPARGLENVSNNILGINSWLTGWYSGALFFLLLFFILEKKIEPWDIVLLVSCSLLAAFYYFSVTQDLIFGPRFYYLMAPVLLLFIARMTWNAIIRERFVVTALLFISLVTFLPFRFPGNVMRYDLPEGGAKCLAKEIRDLRDQKVLVFLGKRGGQDWLNWNDPFLRSSDVLLLDLGSKNGEALSAFPQRRPFYFRLDIDLSHGRLNAGYRLRDQPDSRPAGYFSFSELGLALQPSQEDPEQDFFDSCYLGLFTTPDSRAQIHYLEKQERQTEEESEYRKYFRSGLAHAARLILLPKIAFEEKGVGWKSALDTNLFRQQFLQAWSDFGASGDVGLAIFSSFEKVEKRMDQNGDKNLSNDEIREYLAEKIKILELQ